MPNVFIVGASSGLIIAFVVAVWAAYFVPLVLRRYDEAGKNTTVENAGESGKVIAPTRAAKVDEPAVEATVDAPEATSKAETESNADEVVSREPAPRVRNLDRPAARLAAKRRRRTLLTLIAALVITSGVAVAGVIPVWSIGIPAALIVAWLVACRIQVRGELGLSAPKIRMPKLPRRESDDFDVDWTPRSIEDEETVVLSGQIEDVDPGRPHVMETEALAEDSLDDQVVIAVPSVSTQGEALWDPLPITVPTYVTKPRAGRTIRTIDFNQPGTWTSGHVEGEGTELPQRRDETAEPVEERRAANG